MIISLEILLVIEIISVSLFVVDQIKKQKQLELKKIEIVKMVDSIKLKDDSIYTDDEIIEQLIKYKEENKY